MKKVKVEIEVIVEEIKDIPINVQGESISQFVEKLLNEHIKSEVRYNDSNYIDYKD